MTARRVTAVLVAALAFYLLLVADRALALVREGTVVSVPFGVALLAFPLIGGWLVVQEIRFGFASERLGRELGDDPDPVEELPRTPGGRIDRVAADAVFARRQAAVEASPGDWRAWYRLGVAYGDAGDTARGRRAVKKAIQIRHCAGE